MIRRSAFQVGFVLLGALALAQTPPKLPCDYSGEILRDPAGVPIRLTSKELKHRATHKEDIGKGFMGLRDFKATFVFEVLVGPTGKVLCTRNLLPFPVADAEVDRVLHRWRFVPAKQEGKSVAVLGQIQFYLCNILCEENGMSFSLLR